MKLRQVFFIVRDTRWNKDINIDLHLILYTFIF